MADQYLRLPFHLDKQYKLGWVQVKMDDEGIVVDVIGVAENDEHDDKIIASTWKLYEEFGKDVRDLP